MHDMQLKVITPPVKGRKNSRFLRIYIYIQGKGTENYNSLTFSVFVATCPSLQSKGNIWNIDKNYHLWNNGADRSFV